MREDHWDPDSYQRFERERSQPFHDLVALVRPRSAMRIVDLGCGTGQLTRRLHEQLLARETLGLDRSEAMLERARPLAGGGLRFEVADIARWPDSGALYDLVVSSAALQWLPDHPALLARLTGALAPGGQLAVQMPANFDHPSHVVAAEIARESPFREALGNRAHATNVLAPERYAELLDRLGYAEQHVRLQVYAHRLASRDEVFAWVEGTLLVGYRERLPGDLFDRFVARYRERLLACLEDRQPFLFAFKRILVWAARAAV